MTTNTTALADSTNSISQDENQDAIWEYYQGAGKSSFAASRPRLRWLAKMLPSGSRVLNIGVGDGGFEHEATLRGIRCWSLDPDTKAVAALQAKHGEGTAKPGYANAIPWPNGSFDIVVMSEVLEHIPDGQFEASIDEVYRVLVPGGAFVGTVPADEDLKASFVVCPCCRTFFHRWGHCRSFSADSLRGYLSRRFEAVAVRRKLFPNFTLLNWKGKASAILQRALHAVGIRVSNEHLVFHCRRACG